MAYHPRAWFDATADRMLSSREQISELEVVGDLDTFQRNKRQRMLHWLSSRPVAGRRILEVGCGAGGNLRHLQRRGALVEGADISPRMVELAGRLNRSKGLEIPLHVIDGAHLPHAADEFDVILTVTALQHNHDGPVLDQLVRDMVRVLRPGGEAWIIESIHRKHIVQRAGTHRTREEYEQMFIRSGCALSEYWGLHSNYPALMATYQYLSTGVRKRLMRTLGRDLNDEQDWLRRTGDGARLEGFASRSIFTFCRVADRVRRGDEALAFFVFRKPRAAAARLG